MTKGNNSVVITGLGVVSPIGNNVPVFWRNLLAGYCGVNRLHRFKSTYGTEHIGADVKQFDPLNYMEKKTARDTDIVTQFALAATKEALDDAHLQHPFLQPTRVGIVIGTSLGGVNALWEEFCQFVERGPDRTSPKLMTKWIPNMTAYQVAHQFGIRGPSLTISTACASSNNAIGLAKKMINNGEADIIITGGTESLFIPIIQAGLTANRALSKMIHEPQRASRPFDLRRDGMVMGEGCGIAVLESESHARKRGAKIYCELAGYGSNGEGHHPTAPSPDGSGEVQAMRQALEDAQIDPQEIDYVNAHGTSTPLGDEIETEAIKQVFGEHAYRMSVSSIKGATGHLLGASGAVELIATVKAMEEGIVPPTLNYEVRDPKCDLDYVPKVPRPQSVRAALSNSFGFGGENASIILRTMDARHL